MKKVIALALTLALATSLVACSTSTDSGSTGSDSSDVTATAGFTTGVGAVTSAKITEETEEKGASAQINSTVVAATFEGETVVSVTIDVAQQTAKFDLDGKVDGDVDTRTKIEKGADYGMVGASGIGAEYDAQIEALEAWMTGKTVTEIAAMAMDENTVPTEEDLTSSVTIKVGTYIEALEKAYANAKETTGTPAKTGLGFDISTKISDETEEKGASAQINSTFVTVAVDEAGVIVAVTIDVAQQTAKFDLEGKQDGDIDFRTKIEKGADYGMVGASGIGAEYDAQIAALEAFMIGKTVEEVVAMGVDENTVPTEEDLTSSVTIKVGTYLTALEKALANAK